MNSGRTLSMAIGCTVAALLTAPFAGAAERDCNARVAAAPSQGPGVGSCTLQVTWDERLGAGVEGPAAGVIDTGCELISIEAGQIVDLDCDSGGPCDSWVEGDVLHITATSPTLTVTTPDAEGRSSSCTFDLCEQCAGASGGCVDPPSVECLATPIDLPTGGCGLEVKWHADFSPGCEGTVDAVIDIGCGVFPVLQGQPVGFDCSGHADCGVSVVSNILYLFSDDATLVVTATDSNDNTDQCDLDLCALCTSPPGGDCSDFPCGNNGDKVLLCHVPPGNPDNGHTLCISPSAVPAHLENHPGDHCGPCLADELACPCDLDGSGEVHAGDLLILLNEWQTYRIGPPDLDIDGFVGIGDLLKLFADWGPCE